MKSDRRTKLIEEYEGASASVHDSRAIENLLTEKDEGQALYADSAYGGKDQEKVTKRKRLSKKYVIKEVEIIR